MEKFKGITKEKAREYLSGHWKDDFIENFLAGKTTNELWTPYLYLRYEKGKFFIKFK